MKPWLINLKRVFVNKKYVFIAILIGAIFYLLNVFISEFSFILQEFRLRGFFQSFNLFLVSIMNFANVVEFYSLSSVILIGLLLGILVSLLIFNSSLSNGVNNDKKAGLFAGIGAFLGVLIPGCAVCGVGLLPLIGISASFLLFLPFDGLEIAVLAIFLLIFSVIKTSSSLLECKVN